MPPSPGRTEVGRLDGGYETPVEQPAYVVAQRSYTRCLRAPAFFADFYERLLASNPAIPPMFSGTVPPKQHKLLRHGLGLLLSYANEPDDVLLERLAARHSERGIDVPPGLYEHFVESLVRTIEQHDAHFDQETEAAWREALAPGIDFMTSRYDE